MGLAFTACDNYEEPNPAPQTNPQTSVLSVDDVAVVAAADPAIPFDLTTLNGLSESAQLATISTDAMPDGYTFKVAATISALGKSAEVATEVVQDEENPTLYAVNATADALNAAYKQITKNPALGSVDVTFLVYTVAGIGSQEAVVGGPDNVYGPFAVSLIPFSPESVIADAYTLHVVSAAGATSTYTLSNSGANPYDDPVFSVKVDATAGDKWYVTTASGDAFFGVEEGNESAENGLLYPYSNAAGTVNGVFTSTTPYLFTVNMEEKTYSYILAFDQLYTPGDANGWNQGASQILTTTDYVNFAGFAVLDGSFKFTSALGWDGINYGSTGVDGELTDDGGAGNLTVPARGLYYCQANISAMTYSVALTETWGVIGDATPGGWDAETPLTPSADLLKWSADIVLKDGTLKFRANNDWAINLGGEAMNLTPNADNVPSPGAGTYNVTLDFSAVPYTVTFVKK